MLSPGGGQRPGLPGGGPGPRPWRLVPGRLVPGQPDADAEAVRGVADVGLRPVPGDHGEHPAVGVQHVHRQRRHAPRLRLGDQRAHQRRADAAALPGVGDHHADIGRAGLAGVPRIPRLGLVRGHGVPDDDAAGDGHHGMDVGGPGGQQAEQRGGGRDRAEEPPVTGLGGQPGEEVTERGQVRLAHRPDHGGGAAPGSRELSSIHEPRMAGIAESVN